MDQQLFSTYARQVIFVDPWVKNNETEAGVQWDENFVLPISDQNVWSPRETKAMNSFHVVFSFKSNTVVATLALVAAAGI